MAAVGTNRVWHGSTHWRRISRFATSYAWMVADASRGQWGLVLGVIGLSTAAASTQGLSVGILGFFANNVVQSDPTAEPIWGVIPRDGATMVVVLAASLFLALIGNSLLAWSASRLGRRIGRHYHRRVGRRVLAGLSESRNHVAGYDRRDVASLVLRSGRILGRAVEALLGSVRLVFQTLVAAAIALATEPTLSLAVAPLLLLLLPFVYRLGGKIREVSREFYDTSFTNSAVRVRALIAGADGTQLYEQQPCVVTGYDEDEALGRYFDVFDDIRLAGPRTVLIASSFRSFLIVVVVSLAGYNVINGAFSWGSLTIYVSALGFLLNNLQGLAETITKLNRFFPQLESYRDFLQAMDAPSADTDALPNRLSLEVGSDHGRFSLEPGTVVGYGPLRRLGRLSAAEALAPLARASGLPSQSWCALPFVVDAPDFGPDPGAHAWAAASGASEGVGALHERRTAATARALHALGAPVALIGSEFLADASTDLRAHIFEAFSDRILIVVMGSHWTDEYDTVLMANESGTLDVVDLETFRKRRASAPDPLLEEEDEDEE